MAKKQEPTFAYVFLFVICGIYEDCLSFHIILQLQSFYYSVSNSTWEYEYLFEEWVITFSLPLECLKNMCILFPCNMIRYVENKELILRITSYPFFIAGCCYFGIWYFSHYIPCVVNNMQHLNCFAGYCLSILFINTLYSHMAIFLNMFCNICL